MSLDRAAWSQLQERSTLEEDVLDSIANDPEPEHLRDLLLRADAEMTIAERVRLLVRIVYDHVCEHARYARVQLAMKHIAGNDSCTHEYILHLLHALLTQHREVCSEGPEAEDGEREACILRHVAEITELYHWTEHANCARLTYYQILVTRLFPDVQDSGYTAFLSHAEAMEDSSHPRFQTRMDIMQGCRRLLHDSRAGEIFSDAVDDDTIPEGKEAHERTCWERIQERLERHGDAYIDTRRLWDATIDAVVRECGRRSSERARQALAENLEDRDAVRLVGTYVDASDTFTDTHMRQEEEEAN